jgi:hypothetical protein
LPLKVDGAETTSSKKSSESDYSAGGGELRFEIFYSGSFFVSVSLPFSS